MRVQWESCASTRRGLGGGSCCGGGDCCHYYCYLQRFWESLWASVLQAASLITFIPSTSQANMPCANGHLRCYKKPLWESEVSQLSSAADQRAQFLRLKYITGENHTHTHTSHPHPMPVGPLTPAKQDKDEAKVMMESAMRNQELEKFHKCWIKRNSTLIGKHMQLECRQEDPFHPWQSIFFSIRLSLEYAWKEDDNR